MTTLEQLDAAASHLATVRHYLASSDEPDHYAILSDLAYLARWSRFTLRAQMIEAIEDGATYQDVGDAIGVSRQTVWEALNGRNGRPSVALDQLRLF